MKCSLLRRRLRPLNSGLPSEETPRIQEANILTGHILCELIDEAMFGVQ
jgi:hypothetical protein